MIKNINSSPATMTPGCQENENQMIMFYVAKNVIKTNQQNLKKNKNHTTKTIIVVI